ncbi:hypothetical protein LI291_09490 [Intestinibacillus massiliensis]|nr:hypothetical protein [Intestinibacillus massiliensis]
MAKKDIMDTQDLSEIRKMIGDAPASPSGPDGFNLDDIIAEVSGTVKEVQAGHQAKVENLRPRPAPRAPEARQEPVPAETGRPVEAPQETPRRRFQVIETPLGGQAAAPMPEGGTPVRPAQPQPPVQQAPARAPVQQPSRPAPIPGQDDDDWEEEEDGLSRREQKKLEKARRKAEKRARATADDEEDEEEIRVRDPRVAARSCLRRARGLAGRSIFVLLMALAAAYLSVAGGMGWPLPEAVNYSVSPVATVLAMMLMQFLAMFVGIDVIGLGFYNLFTGAPDRKTLVAVANLASIAHGLTIILRPAWGGWLPYCAVSILLLFAAMQEDKARFSARYRAFKAATLTQHPMGVFSHNDQRDGFSRAAKARMLENTPFLIEMERTDTADNFGMVYAPIALAACVIFALIVSIGRGEPTRFFWALSALLSVSAPAGVLCAAGPAYRNVSRRLLGEGAAIAGARSARRLRKTRQAVLSDGDLFPAGSVTVDGMKNYGNYSAEKLLAYAAAVTGGQGLEIGRVFAESLREQYGRPVKAQNVLQYESGGLSADVGGDSVLVGTAAFLTKLGVRLRDVHGMENAVFVVINSQLAGAFNLTYHPTAQTYGALHALSRLRIKPLLATRDFNISPAMVESLFELRNGATADEEGGRAFEMTEPSYVKNDAVCGILSHDGITPFTQMLQAADKLAGAVRANLALGAFSGVCGILLVFYLAFLFTVTALTPKNILLYLVLWYVPVFFITFHTRKKY